MKAVIEDKASIVVKEFQKPVVDARLSKVSKKTREKKLLKGLQIEAIEITSPDSESVSDSKDKRSQAIIINGKTYTCATCKTGHRVGVCKHAKERPMTATHPPGRPPAGAPKKIICDCPKQCNCKKRDCKCARQCSCTQIMYMLVYVPAPGDIQATEDESGTWRLGEEVTTDLKGNVLTPEQIKERQQLKEAQKSLPREAKPASTIAQAATIAELSTFPNAETKPAPNGGCCTHKENVSSRDIAAEASPQTGRVSKAAAGGCNCGYRCACAFCPDHPDNPASRTMARQAMHFAGNFYPPDMNSIMPFMPVVPSAASCMGGLPQFAISHSNQMPSQFDLQQTFPNRGYVIGYPFQYRRCDSIEDTVSPFHMPQQFRPDMGILADTELQGLQTPLTTPRPDLSLLGYPQDSFDIGNAFVASAGTGEWNSDLLSPSDWPLESSGPTLMFDNFLSTPEASQNLASHLELSAPGVNEGLAFGSDLIAQDENTFFNPPMSLPKQQELGAALGVPTSKHCCGSSGKKNVQPAGARSMDDVLYPVAEEFPPAAHIPYG